MWLSGFRFGGPQRSLRLSGFGLRGLVFRAWKLAGVEGVDSGNSSGGRKR